MNSLLQDLRFALRGLKNSPLFAMTAILTLAIGIGANGAIFSVVNAILIKPLPYVEPDRLVVLKEVSYRGEWNISYPNFLDWRQRNTVFEQMAVYRPIGNSAIQLGSLTDMVNSAWSEPALFPLLGARFVIGRPFSIEEEKNDAPVVVVSKAVWTRDFGADRNIIGKAITIDGQPRTVVGVLDDFPLDPSDLWFPLGKVTHPVQLDRANHPGFKAVARLKATVTLLQARQEMIAIAKALEEQYPSSNFGWTVSVTPMNDSLVGGVRPTLIVLISAVGFVLLIACSNIANMLLARASTRVREMAIRCAVGATRRDVVRLYFAEGAMIAILGATAGSLLAWWIVDSLRPTAAQFLPQGKPIGIDHVVLLFSLAISVVACILFSTAPAWNQANLGPGESLSITRHSQTASRRDRRFLWGVIAAEVAFSAVLLVGAGLMVRTLHALDQVDLGFRTDHLLMAAVRPAYGTLKTSADQAAYDDALLSRLQNTPGIESVAISWPGAANTWGWSPPLDFREHPVEKGHEPIGLGATVSNDFFRTMGIAVVRGRTFNAQDRAGSPIVGVVNEAFVRRFFAFDRDPVGMHFRLAGDDKDFGQWATIVGIVRDTRSGPTADIQPRVYWSSSQFPQYGASILLRTTVPPDTLRTTVKQQILAVNSTNLISGMKTMDEVLYEVTARQRFTRLLLLAFSSVALLLAGIGIYGVLAYSVSRRTREIGIRMALGANVHSISSLVVSESAAPVLIGAVAGLSISVALAGFMKALLFHVQPLDPITMISVFLLLAVVSLLAAWLPVYRATCVDPADTLRAQE
jgi:putative ABC transport system permease protein